jgi:hypothetical protein
VFSFETLQTALSGADLYYWFVSSYGNLRHLNNPYATPFDVLMLESLVSLSVQFFFAYRIWALSLKKCWWYSLIICLVSPSKCAAVRYFSSLQCSTIDAVAALAGSIYVSVVISMLPSFSLLVGLSRNCQWCNNEIPGDGKASFLLDTHLTLPLMTMSLRFGLLGTRWLTSLSLLQCSITYTTFPSEFILRN